MLVAEELDMDMSQMFYAPSRDLAERDRRRRRQRRHLEPLDAGPRCGRVREAGAAEDGLDEARRSGREPDASSKGVVSGGGKSVTYGELIGGKNFNFVFPAVADERDARSGDREAGQPVQARRHDRTRGSTSRPR